MAEERDSTRKLTEGRPMGLIIGFSLPILIGMLFQQFYSLVDTIIVGKCLGVDALAAVGSTGSVNFMILGFCMGVCSGFAIPIAQQFGAGNQVSLRRYVAGAVWLSAVFAIVLTVIVCLLCRRILVWMQTPDNISHQAYDYIIVIFVGIPVTCLYNLTAGIMRSLGDSRTPVYFLLLASVINIVLDFLLIAGLHFGVEGAAYATVFSQLVAGIGCLFYIKKKFPMLRLQKEDWQLRPTYIWNLCSMGVPMGLQYSITAIGSVLLQSAVNGLGSDVVAANTAAAKLSMFVVCPFDALGSAMATYGGQNIGAGKIKRTKEGLKAATFLGGIYSVLAFLLLFFVGKYLLLLFLSAEDTVILSNAGQFLLVQAAFYFPLAMVNIVRFLIQGMGFPTFAILAGVMEMVARAMAAFFLVPHFGFMGAAFASPFAWIMADAFLIPAFFYVYRKLSRSWSATMK